MITPTVMQQERARAKSLVERMYAKARTYPAGSHIRVILEEAAAELDGFQAGLTLVPPHKATGYELVQTSARMKVVAVVGH